MDSNSPFETIAKALEFRMLLEAGMFAAFGAYAVVQALKEIIRVFRKDTPHSGWWKVVVRASAILIGAGIGYWTAPGIVPGSLIMGALGGALSAWAVGTLKAEIRRRLSK